MRRSHGLLIVLRDEEVTRVDIEQGVHHAALLHGFFQAFEFTNRILANGPQAHRVILDGLGRETRLERIAVKLLERETETAARRVIVARHIGHHTRLDLQLDVVAINDLLVLDPLVGVGDALNVGRRNDISGQQVTAQCDHCRREDIRHRQAMETDAIGQHGDDLAAIGKS